MTKSEKGSILPRLAEARAGIEKLLPQVDQGREIYPGWTIKEMLDHMAGWDDAIIASLRAHVSGNEPGTPAERGVDVYNAQTVSTREALDYAHTRKEWEATRGMLVAAIQQMPPEKFSQPLVLPWGETGTVTTLVEIFISHEDYHAREIKEWLKNPNQPLLGKH